MVTLRTLAYSIHRALSWLDKSELCEDDYSKFIFLHYGPKQQYLLSNQQYELRAPP